MLNFTLFYALLIGFSLGFVMQRGRFCMVGCFRDIYMNNDYRMFIALLIAITIQSIGIFILADIAFIKLPAGSFPWLAVTIGGVIFGIGMGFAGSCSTGAYYRAAEGITGSIIAVISIMFSSYIYRIQEVQAILKPIFTLSLPEQTIYQTFAVSPWVIVLFLTAITLFLVWRYLCRPKIIIAKLKPRKTGIAHLLFEVRWHPFFTALLIGIIAIFAWSSSFADGRVGGLGISGPSAQFVELIISGKSGFFRWAGWLLIGIVAGSFIAAKGSSEFRFRYPGHSIAIQCFVGGFLMGIGSGLAGGCLLGNALVGTAYLSWQGWLFIPTIVFGSWLFTYSTIMRTMQLKSLA